MFPFRIDNIRKGGPVETYFNWKNSSDDDEGEFLLESFKPSFTCLLTKSAEGVDVRLHHNMVFSET